MEIRIPKSKIFYFILGMMFVITSCDSNRVFDEYKALDDNKWTQENPIEFEIPITDTISRNNLFVNIRNNAELAQKALDNPLTAWYIELVGWL